MLRRSEEGIPNQVSHRHKAISDLKFARGSEGPPQRALRMALTKLRVNMLLFVCSLLETLNRRSQAQRSLYFKADPSPLIHVRSVTEL